MNLIFWPHFRPPPIVPSLKRFELLARQSRLVERTLKCRCPESPCGGRDPGGHPCGDRLHRHGLDDGITPQLVGKPA
jgi:hypothetical protein